MTDHSELKRLAEAVLAMNYPWEHTVRDGRLGKTSTEYARLAHPSNVLALIAEIEALKGPHDWLAEDLIKELVDNAQAIQENADDGEDDPFVIVLLASASRIRRQEANIDKLRAENERLAKTADCWDRLNVQNKALSDSFRAERDQLKAENDAARKDLQNLRSDNAQLTYALKHQEQSYLVLRADRDRLKAENEALRATADLQKLLPEVSDALEELELHGLHSDQGYRKLKDWYRKAGLAYRVIQGPMFDAEHGELVLQNTWLRSVVEHYAQQHAPLEPIQDLEGWSARLPGYDLPALLKDAERYRWLRRAGNTKAIALVAEHCLDALDETIDAALGQGEQS